MDEEEEQTPQQEDSHNNHNNNLSIVHHNLSSLFFLTTTCKKARKACMKHSIKKHCAIPACPPVWLTIINDLKNVINFVKMNNKCRRQPTKSRTLHNKFIIHM